MRYQIDITLEDPLDPSRYILQCPVSIQIYSEDTVRSIHIQIVTQVDPISNEVEHARYFIEECFLDQRFIKLIARAINIDLFVLQPRQHMPEQHWVPVERQAFGCFYQ